MAKRTVLPVENLSQDTQRLFDVLNNSSDLGVVLVGTSYLDASLGSLLHRFFIAGSTSEKLLDVGGGAIGTYSARCDLSYVLGLIDKPLYQDLSTIGRIRNEFAHHHLEHDFEVPTMVTLCSELKYVESLRDSTTGKPFGLEGLVSNTRGRFVLSLVMISQRLLLNGLSVKRRGSIA
jgi:DNA-binding MltR family transcriptional regulator